MLRLDDALLSAAAEIEAASLRSLDAIHLAAAQALGDRLEAVLTYDTRMAAAATELGLRVARPA